MSTDKLQRGAREGDELEDLTGHAASAPGRLPPTARAGRTRTSDVIFRAADTAPAAPSTPLIAHGLEVSQRGDAAEVEADRAASAMVAGQPTAVSAGRVLLSRDPYDDSWGKDYHKRPGKRDQNIDMDEYKETIGEDGTLAPELAPASAWEQQADAWNKTAAPTDPNHEKATTKRDRTGYKRATVLSAGEWETILQASGEPPTVEKCRPMLSGVNEAFTIMMLDTAQSQALYIAHLAGETGGKLEETIDKPRDYSNETNGDFRGRGPVQVTFKKGYVKSLAYLEKRAEQLEKEADEKEAKAKQIRSDNEKGAKGEGVVDPWAADPKKLEEEAATARKQAALCREAVEKIKADPDAAADPKYTFLFSAAFMHMSGKVRSSSGMGDAESFDGNSSAAVAGSKKTFDQQAKDAAAAGDSKTVGDMTSANNRKAVKEKVYARAMAILTGKQKPKEMKTD